VGLPDTVSSSALPGCQGAPADSFLLHNRNIHFYC
jgi:hypothetical protein